MSISWAHTGSCYICSPWNLNLRFYRSSRWTKPKRSPSHLEAIRHMVPDTSITESDDTNPHTSTCSPPRSRPTNKHSREEPRLEPHSMENKLRRLILHGVDLDAYENILHLDRQKARQEYRRIQKRYLDWCRERSLEALQPARTNQPHQLSGPWPPSLSMDDSNVRELLFGYSRLFDDRSPTVSSRLYNTFFKSLNEQTIRSSVRQDVDIFPGYYSSTLSGS